MKRYTKRGNEHKFVAEDHSLLDRGPTKLAKLVAKNANRSLKKGVRQKAKNEIRKRLGY